MIKQLTNGDETMTTAEVSQLVEIKLAIRNSRKLALAPYLKDLAEDIDLFNYPAIIDDLEILKSTLARISSQALTMLEDIE